MSNISLPLLDEIKMLQQQVETVTTVEALNELKATIKNVTDKAYRDIEITYKSLKQTDKIQRKEFLKLQNLNQGLEDTQREIITMIGAIGEARSKETTRHVRRVAEYTQCLALHYGLCQEEAEMLRKASPLHDVGKITTPSYILNKESALSVEEFEIMKDHAQAGYDLLSHSDKPLLKMAAIIALEHHEKYDGSGYPSGKKGEEIHLYGRITGIADVFDALGADRCYKKGWSLEEVLDYFKEQRGKQFDPVLIDLFFEHIDEFIAIRDSLAHVHDGNSLCWQEVYFKRKLYEQEV